MELPLNYRYTDTHEWARFEENGEITVGITHHAQSLLGDIVFVELPAVGKKFEVKQEVAVVESVKAAADIYAPVAGVITAVNNALTQAPECINQSCYHEGWMFRIRPHDLLAFSKLLDATTYQELEQRS